MEIDEAIRGRRSIRRYENRPVSQELVREVLNAGTWAPSAKNDQQWRFTVLTGAAKKKLTDLFRSELQTLSIMIGTEAMGSSLASCQIMEQAPVLIMVWNAGGKETEHVKQEIEESFSKEQGSKALALRHKADIQSVAAAVENMLLKAHSIGLGSLWICDIYYAVDALTKHLGKKWELVAALTLGWPDAAPKPHFRRTLDEVAEFIE